MSRPASDVVWETEPTALSDQRCELMRRWYEDNRETWWRRHTWPGTAARTGLVADDFAFGLLEQARAILIDSGSVVEPESSPEVRS